MTTERELLAEREENRCAFLEMWGSEFAEMAMEMFWLQASADGNYVCLFFRHNGGKDVKVSIPLNLVQDFTANFALALDRISLIKEATEPNAPTQ